MAKAGVLSYFAMLPSAICHIALCILPRSRTALSACRTALSACRIALTFVEVVKSNSVVDIKYCLGSL